MAANAPDRSCASHCLVEPFDRLHFLPLQQVKSAKHGVPGLRFFPLQLCLWLGRCSQPSIAYIGCEEPLSYCSCGKEVLAQPILLAVVLDKSS